ncbi:ATP-binding cassette, subfamily C [Janthinobacterium sp. 344]|nr:ATP-binding cassette, subfamily C [Janthinobacterium sp. 551a]SFB65589.1 ATP-binding cassette, subfamily C [Janthinobacterium sp. 344]
MGLLLLAGATEGVGLMLLLPILRLGSSRTSPQDAVSKFLSEHLQMLGLPLSLSTLLVLMVAVIACRSLIEWCRDIMAADVQLRFVAALRQRTMAAVAGASWHYLGSQSHAYLHAILCRDVEALRQSAVQSLQLAVQGILLMTNVVVAIMISPILTVAAVAIGLILALVARNLVRRAQASGRQFERHQRSIQRETADFVNGLKLVKSMSAEGKHVDAFNVSSAGLHQATRRHKTAGATVRAMLQLSAAIAVSVLVMMAQGGNLLAFPEMILLALVFARMVPILRDMYHGLQTIANSLPAYAEIEAVTAQCTLHAEAKPNCVAAIVLRHQLQLQDVTYRYSPAAPNAIDGINVVIEAGSMVALVGESGAGKTTLADMILGLLQPDSGCMTVDGIPITGESVHAWRRSVAYVPQDSFFLNASIRENLTWTAQSVTDATLLAALEQAQALDFVSRRPGGLDALIGDHGRQLSGGERQRLALARALLRQPSVLVLDEPASALDPANARAVYRAIENLRGTMTIVMIVHDLAKVRNADQVLVLERGRLVEHGAPQDAAPASDHPQPACNGFLA